jgi:thiamine-phosphate pyrophosphorylase
VLRYYVTDRARADVFSAARRAIDAGVDMIQVREKDMDGGPLLRLVCQIVAAAKGTRTRILVNDRLDVALAAGADGVHLPANGLRVALVRSRIDLVGISTHTLDEVQRAEADGADFAVFGPIFETPGKTAVGLERLSEVTRGTGLPVYGIGGVTMKNATDVIAAGATGIAGIRLFQS